MTSSLVQPGPQRPEDAGPDFIEALARGLDVIRGFEPGRAAMSLAEVAAKSGLARPTARRVLITLAALDYVRQTKDGYLLTPKVLELGMAYVRSTNIWELSRPHLERLSSATRESCSIAQLDGSDVVYVARVAMPKIVTLSVTIGTRFPALQTSLGKVLLAAMSHEDMETVLAQPSRSGVAPRWNPTDDERDDVLRQVRARGWALTDEHLAAGIRSVAAPIRDGDGLVVAAINVNAHAAETSVETLLEEHLPLLLTAASDISADWTAYYSAPQSSAVT